MLRINKWSILKQHKYVVFILISLLVLTPLLRSGYILTLDMVFTQRIPMPTSISNSYLFYSLLHLLSLIFPSDLLEKSMLFLILYLSGLGMYKLIQDLVKRKSDIYQNLSRYFSGILYMINPFTYDRFMTGQYEVLLGYALLPWFTRSLLSFLGHLSLKRSITLTFWALLISIVSIHTLGLIAILVSIILMHVAWKCRDNRVNLKTAIKYGLLSVIIFFIASSYWLVPLMLNHGSIATTIDSFNYTDQSAFATLGGSVIGRFDNVFKLQGFWAESRGLYDLPQNSVSTWGFITLIVWLLVIIGGFSYWRSRQRSVVIIFGISALIAAVLAIGTFNNWLATYIPFFAGYREPEKFVGLAALAFAVFAGSGVASVLKYFHSQGSRFFLILGSIVLLLVPLIWTSTMLWGFDDQLVPVQYPADWFIINKRLDADPGNFQVLVLPWHLYMSYNFAGRIIANPAPQFFDKPTIVSDNPEYKGIAPNTQSPEEVNITNILDNASKGKDLGGQLIQYHVKYVLLALDDDYVKYGYLNHQADLQPIIKGATLELYRNEAYKGN